MVRVKRRYIILKINYKQTGNNQAPESDAFIRELRERIYQTYGDFGVSCLNRGFSVKRYDKEGNMILCVRKGVHEMVMSNTPLINTVARVPCCVTILHLSGTMRGCLKELKLDHLKNLRATIAKQSPQLTNRVHTNVETYIAKKQPEEEKVDKKKLKKGAK